VQQHTASFFCLLNASERRSARGKTSPKLRGKRAGSSVENGGEKFKCLSAYRIRTGILSAKTGESATPGRHHGNENPQGKPEGKGKITLNVLTKPPICKGTPFRLAHLLAVIPCPSRPRPVCGLMAGLFAVCYSGVASQLPRRLFSCQGTETMLGNIVYKLYHLPKFDKL
jgi:hypothetical protein